MDASFRELIASHIFEYHQVIADRWLRRLRDLLPVEERDIFPSPRRLDHIPDLIQAIGGYLQNPEEEAIAANTMVLDKARELGALRHEQQASLHQLLREYQLLSGVLVSFVQETIAQQQLTPAADDVIAVVCRLHGVVGALSQVTIEAFVELYNGTIAQQSERLEEFTRMAAHEWRQPLSVVQFNVTRVLSERTLPDHARRSLQVAERNVERLVALTHKLETIARLNDAQDNALVQEASLTLVARQAANQLREMADTHQVEIHIQDLLPIVRADVGRLELTFLNLMSNAIKYSDPTKTNRFVDISGDVAEGGWQQVFVRDNGLGIPGDALATIFQRFTRAHEDRIDTPPVSGLGLGLSIVEDCVRALGGQITVQSEEGLGTTFELRLPNGE